MSEFISTSREQTQTFAEQFAKTLKSGDIVLLDGEWAQAKRYLPKA